VETTQQRNLGSSWNGDSNRVWPFFWAKHTNETRTHTCALFEFNIPSRSGWKMNPSGDKVKCWKHSERRSCSRRRRRKKTTQFLIFFICALITPKSHQHLGGSRWRNLLIKAEKSGQRLASPWYKWDTKFLQKGERTHWEGACFWVIRPFPFSSLGKKERMAQKSPAENGEWQGAS